MVNCMKIFLIAFDAFVLQEEYGLNDDQVAGKHFRLPFLYK